MDTQDTRGRKHSILSIYLNFLPCMLSFKPHFLLLNNGTLNQEHRSWGLFLPNEFLHESCKACLEIDSGKSVYETSNRWHVPRIEFLPPNEHSDHFGRRSENGPPSDCRQKDTGLIGFCRCCCFYQPAPPPPNRIGTSSKQMASNRCHSTRLANMCYINCSSLRFLGSSW